MPTKNDSNNWSNPFITPAAVFAHLISNPLDPQPSVDAIQHQFDVLATQGYLGSMVNEFSDALYQEISNLHKNLDHPFQLLDVGNLLEGNLLCRKGGIYHWAAEKFDYDIPEWKCFCEEDYLSTQGAEGGGNGE